jgi:hypothetical protein
MVSTFKALFGGVCPHRIRRIWPDPFRQGRSFHVFLLLVGVDAGRPDPDAAVAAPFPSTKFRRGLLQFRLQRHQALETCRHDTDVPGTVQAGVRNVTGQDTGLCYQSPRTGSEAVRKL